MSVFFLSLGVIFGSLGFVKCKRVSHSVQNSALLFDHAFTNPLMIHMIS